jgi:hypothetical protein
MLSYSPSGIEFGIPDLELPSAACLARTGRSTIGFGCEAPADMADGVETIRRQNAGGVSLTTEVSDKCFDLGVFPTRRDGLG